MADKLKRTSNLRVEESVFRDMKTVDAPSNVLPVKRLQMNGLKTNSLASSDMSPITTQKVADALNDYLQEQAELLTGRK